MKNQLLSAWALPLLLVLRVASTVTDGELVTLGDFVAEVDTDGTYTAGRIRVDVSAGGTKATGTLTTTGTQATDGDTVTIGATVYRLKTTPAQAYDVKILTDAATTLANLKKAINASGTPGTEYFAGTLVHPTVSAGAITATTLVVTALVTGTGGNAIASTETAATLSWGAATLASGAQPSAAEFTTALTTAWNAGQGVWTATRISANEVLFTTKVAGAYPYAAASETLAGSNNAWAAAAPYGGRGAGLPTADIPTVSMASRVPNATEVALGNLHFLFPFTVGNVVPSVRVTSGGAAKAWDGAVVITGNRVTLDNSGSTDWAATDTVTVLAGPA